MDKQKKETEPIVTILGTFRITYENLNGKETIKVISTNHGIYLNPNTSNSVTIGLKNQ